MNFLTLLLLSFFSLSSQSETVDLEITITNIKTLKGNIELGVYNDPQLFLEKGRAYKSFTKKVTGDSMVITVKDLPKTEYAVAIYHDVNADNECNLNFFGFPVEPYGFSNNFKPKLSKPSFSDCKFQVNANNPSIQIKLSK